jgi:hypothetical protein
VAQQTTKNNDLINNSMQLTKKNRNKQKNVHVYYLQIPMMTRNYVRTKLNVTEIVIDFECSILLRYNL